MSSVLDIANRALTEVGESPITQEEFDNRSTKGAKIVSQRYDASKSQVLRSYFWRQAETVIKIEATTITETAADLKYGITVGGVDTYQGDTFVLYLKTAGSPNIYYEAPVYKYNRYFALPGDVVRLKLVTDVNSRLENYAFYGGKIAADTDTVYAVYTKDLDERDMDDHMADTISLHLAMKSARFLGASDDLPQITQDFFSEWRLAKSFDAQQDANRRLDAVGWLEDRLGSSSSGSPYPQLT
jgi:hypothetical protein